MTAGITTAAHPRQKAPVVRISAEAVPKQAFADLLNGVRLHALWTRLAFHDVRQRFRRSVLGPFWLTLSMGTMVATLGIVFSSLFHHSESLISEFCSRRVLMQHGVLQSAS